MIKVLHIGKFYPPYFGGIETVNYDIVEGVNKKGIQVDVLCSNHERGRKESKEKYKIYRANTLKVVASTPLSFDLVFLLKKIQREYDIIHVHLPNPLANLAVFLTRPKARIILHWHSDIVKQKNLLKLYKPLQTWLLKRADAIIATSPNYIKGSEFLQKYLSKTSYIPLGVEKMRVNETKLTSLREQYKGKKIVFALGRLIYYKGFEYLIDAAEFLPENILVLIGGVGELYEEFQKRISAKGLENKVQLLGKIPFDELGAYYELCDVYCMPSIEKSEAFGVVQIEAMSFGKPIVSTDIEGSGVPWVNENEVSGVVVQPKNSKDLANGLIKVLNSSEGQYQQYATNAEKRFLELFTKEKMVQDFYNLYNSIIEGS